METYKIVRMFYPSQNRDSKVMRKGLSLDEAQAHCQDDSTKKEGVYFDCYTAE